MGLEHFLEQIKEPGIKAIGIAAVKKLCDLVLPLFIKRLSTAASVDELRKTGEVQIELFKKQVDAIGTVRADLPEASFEIKDGKIQMNLTASQERAVNRMILQAERETKNIDAVIESAAEQLKSAESVSDKPVDEDWFARFIDSARLVSDEQMQSVWSKILAGEVCKPGSFSLRTLDVVRNLTKEEAGIFSKLAALAYRRKDEAYVFKPSYKDLELYDINIGDIVLLCEAGLIIDADNLGMRIPKKEESPWHLLFDKYRIKIECKLSIHNLTLPVIPFTRAGVELLRFTQSQPPWEYMARIMSYFIFDHVEFSYAPIISRQGDKEEMGEFIVFRKDTVPNSEASSPIPIGVQTDEDIPF